MTKPCIECGVELLEEENWYPSFVKKNHHKCKTCYDKRRLVNRINKEGPKIGYLAQLIKLNGEQEYNAYPEGHVYVITNPAWPKWYKVGSSLSVTNRRNSYQTSSPLRDFKLKYKKFFENRRTAESKIHVKLEEGGLERSGEWFKSPTLRKIKEVIDATA